MAVLSQFSATWRKDIVAWLTGAAGLGVPIKGTTTNDSAAAGYVGELIESQILLGSAISLTDNTAANITSISLTAGHWHVWGISAFNGVGVTATMLIGAINTVSATMPTAPALGAQARLEVAISGNVTNNIGIPGRDLKLAATTTVYLLGFARFSAGSINAFGYIGARRVR